MATEPEILERWRYLRQMLSEQLEAFESGAIKMHSNDINISPAAIAKLKRDIAEFDALIDKDGASRGSS